MKSIECLSLQPINEIVPSVFENLRKITDEINYAKSTGNKEVRRNLYAEKGYNMLLLLLARKTGLANFSVSFTQFPGERHHTYSLNHIFLIRGYNNKPESFDLDARTISLGFSGDARDVIKLAQPYSVNWETPMSMATRTYDEVIEIDVQRQKAQNEDDSTTSEHLADLKLYLAKRVLSQRQNEEMKNMRVKRKQGDREIITSIAITDSKKIVFPDSQRIFDLVNKYGGYDADLTQSSSSAS